MSIDWFAVQCAVNGTPMRLNRPEQEAAVRLMAHRIRDNFTGDLEAGERELLSNEEVCRRIGAIERTVLRIKAGLPEADRLRCEVCRELMWVRHDGFIEAHADAFFQQCPMSERIYEADWEQELAATAMWLAQKLRCGDRDGVWEYLERLPLSDMRPLLMAALAGVSEAEDPFEWLKETA